MKSFIAITTRIIDNKLVLVATNKGYSVYNENGLTLETVLDFLWSLRKLKVSKDIVFASYASSLDNEFIFSSLPKDDKDKLFQSFNIKKQLAELEIEQDDLQESFYNNHTPIDEKERIDFDLYVNKLSQIELSDVSYKEYKLKLINGKLLRISRKKENISFFDLYGFFRKPLYEMVSTWLSKNIPTLKQENIYLDKETLRAFAGIEAKYIALLGEKLASELSNIGCNLKSFHGASAVSSWLLTKSKAKTEFYNYNKRRNLSSELYKAMLQAFYAGRAEQFKIGTIENVNLYDINSAYAYACLDLPVFTRKPLFCDKWQDSTNIFSIWFVEYDFTSLSDKLYFGYLPFRISGKSNTGYYKKGKGYYYYPEVKFVLDNFPKCIEIKHGFCLPNQTSAEFTKTINALYNTRKELQAENNPLEKVIKLALSSLYGKFCQHNGRGYYVNYFYAGYVTSKTRAMLLEATKGYEKSTICFLTDAIHTRDILPLSISNEIGAFKQSNYTQVTYLDNGIYQAVKDGEIVKTASKGYRKLDFAKALAELNAQQSFDAEQKLFIGHNLHTLNSFTFKDYLSVFTFMKQESALEEKRFPMREFEQTKKDLSTDFLDSYALNGSTHRESGLYVTRNYKESDAAIDALFAGKI